ncbi:LPXTG cell wall anchor domain-containing protein [Schleiferilactobacillus harbinensis]|uniref:LPXTG cell wall anchor domain-containing protein n=1 Tax=Schleiferilactobacillus harbinensis TaxID=304207 RepID=UPI0039EC04CC
MRQNTVKTVGSLVASAALWFLLADPARADQSTVQFTVVNSPTGQKIPPAGNNAPPGWQTATPAGSLTPGDTPPGRFPQTGEQIDPWLLIIGGELVMLSGLGLITLARKRGGQHA